MSCQQVRFQIVEGLGQGVQPGFEVEFHLMNCEACSRFYEEQCHLEDLLNNASLQLDPPARIWARIETHITTGTGEPRRWGWRYLADLFQIPAMRAAVVALGLLLVISVSLLRLGSGTIEPAVLAQVDAYRLDVEGNPFIPLSEKDNPFLKLDVELEGNPFSLNRSPQ